MLDAGHVVEAIRIFTMRRRMISSTSSPRDTQRSGGTVGEYIVRILNGMAGLSPPDIGSSSSRLEIMRISDAFPIGQAAQYLMGPAIGVGVAVAVKAPPLGIFCAAVTGALGAGTFGWEGAVAVKIMIGEPVGALLAGLAGAEASKLVAGKTKVDIILVPLTTFW